jgi:hypothetical protein
VAYALEWLHDACRLIENEYQPAPYAPFSVLQRLQKLQFGAKSLDVLQVSFVVCGITAISSQVLILPMFLFSILPTCSS